MVQILLLIQKKEDPIKAVMEATDRLGADEVIDSVNASRTVEIDMQILRRRDRLVIVGLFWSCVTVILITMPTRAYRLIGFYTGNMIEMAQLVSLAKREAINPIVIKKFKMKRQMLLLFCS